MVDVEVAIVEEEVVEGPPTAALATAAAAAAVAAAAAAGAEEPILLLPRDGDEAGFNPVVSDMALSRRAMNAAGSRDAALVDAKSA